MNKQTWVLVAILLVALIGMAKLGIDGKLNIANPLEKSEEISKIEDSESFRDLEKVDGVKKEAFTSKVVEFVANLFSRSSIKVVTKNTKEDILTETVKKYLLKSKLETTLTSSRGISTIRAIYPAVNLLAVGDVYVSDVYNYRIQKFDSSGTYITQWGTQGSGNGQFNPSFGIDTDMNGYVYVADIYNYRIQKFDSSGTYITQWGTQGSGNGQFNSPNQITVDFLGYVYVVDGNNYRIQKFDSSGTYITQWGSQGSGNGQFDAPAGIAVDALNNIYVVDGNNNRIQKFDSSGTYITQWGTQGSGNGQFDAPKDLDVDQYNNVYVVDVYNERIQKFDSSGTYITQWGSVGTGNGQFITPQGVAVDKDDYVYVADTANYRIQKFDSSGTYITQWGTQGSGNGQFNMHSNIAISKDAPDLVVDSISAPSTISVGATTDNPFYPSIGFPINPAPPVPVDVTIKNIGNADAIIPANMSITLAIHCPGPDFTLCGWPNFGANNFNFFGFKRFPIGTAITLPPGGTHTIQTDSFFLFNPYSPPYSGTTTYTGPMNLWATIDTVDGYLLNDNLVDESDETNNIGPYLPITVIP